MASLGLRSAARVLRRSISDFAGKTLPTKHSGSKFNMEHGKHIQQADKSTFQPGTPAASIAMKLDECTRILSGTHEIVKVMLRQARADEAWDKVVLCSSVLFTLAFCANEIMPFDASSKEMPFDGTSKEMPGEIEPLN